MTAVQDNSNFDEEWDAAFASFSPKEVAMMTGMSPQLLRLWRKRGYVPEKERGEWSKHTPQEVVHAYLLYAFSQLGIAPSQIVSSVEYLVPDLLFFTITSSDGACSFHGAEHAVDSFRRQFDETLDLARQLVSPGDERRYVVAASDGVFRRYSDLSAALESHTFEYFRCVDLVSAGLAIAARAQRPLVSFYHRETSGADATVRRLSHGQR